MKNYDIAAYIWPAYTGDEPRTHMFWPDGYGEWQTVKAMQPRFPGHVWPRKPLWGYVNEADPYVMEMEINAAADHGVNVFIYDWYWYDGRPFLEQCLDQGFLKARNNDRMKFFLMWANHTATTMWDSRIADTNIPIWTGAVDRRTFEFIADYTIERYFSHPSYYKIDGKPVYLLFDLENLVSGFGGVRQTREALDWFRKRVIAAGFPGLELHLTIRSRQYMSRMLDEKTDILHFINETDFDGVTHYQFFDFADMGRSYESILEDVKREWEFIDANIRAPYYPQVSLGWDSNPRYHVFHPDVCTNNTPEAVRKGFELAKAYLQAHPERKAPLLTVNSWNEWTEGSYLHPDNINGYGYLQTIWDVFCK